MSRIRYEEFSKLTIQHYLQYVQAWTLAIGRNEFKNYIFTIFFQIFRYQT